MAVTDKILTENPVLKVPRAKHQKEPADPFSRDEMETILADIQSEQDCQVHDFTEFWFWSGLRTSEIFNLQWNNVDLATGTMLVTEAVVRGIHEDSTKTNVARTVRLNSRSLAAVQRQRQQGSGYRRGLRCHYHGDKFGTSEQHASWLQLRSIDNQRQELGRGYRDGFAGNEPAPL